MIVVILFESTNSHPYNIAAMSILRYSVKYIVIFDIFLVLTFIKFLTVYSQRVLYYLFKGDLLCFFFFPFCQCVISVLMHIKDLES